MDKAARRYKPPPPPPRPQPTEYALLVREVYDALDRANRAAGIGPWCVLGIGHPNLPLLGHCPSCIVGTVAVWTLDTPDGPEPRAEGCSAGCPPDLVLNAILPPVARSVVSAPTR